MLKLCCSKHNVLKVFLEEMFASKQQSQAFQYFSTEYIFLV